MSSVKNTHAAGPRAERPSTGRTWWLLALVLSTQLGACAAASVGDTETSLRPLLPTKRVTPPAADRNSVWVEFADHTGEFAEFDDEMWNRIVDEIEARGWKYTPDYEEANYAVWATVRALDEGGEEAVNRSLRNMGAITGGAVVAGGVYAAGGSRTATAVSGVASGGLIGLAMEWLMRTQWYHLVIDLQLAERVEFDVNKSGSERRSDELVTTGGMGVGITNEGAASSIDSDVQQEYEHTVNRLEYEQRVVAFAKGRRLEKSVAAEALVPKIVHSIGNQLPRMGRTR